MAWLVFFLALIGSYLVGSINAAVIISKFIAHDDVRDHGSGNAGMTNVMRTMGVLPGLLTLLIDSAKGVLCCLLARLLVFPYVFGTLGFEFLRPEYAVYYCGILCLIGHIYPLFFGFRGGKGVATTLGVLLRLPVPNGAFGTRSVSDSVPYYEDYIVRLYCCQHNAACLQCNIRVENRRCAECGACAVPAHIGHNRYNYIHAQGEYCPPCTRGRKKS